MDLKGKEVRKTICHLAGDKHRSGSWFRAHRVHRTKEKRKEVHWAGRQRMETKKKKGRKSAALLQIWRKTINKD